MSIEQGNRRSFYLLIKIGPDIYAKINPSGVIMQIIIKLQQRTEMELKIARTDVTSKPKKIDVKKIEDMVKKEGTVILYFDRDNSHKDLLSLQDHFENEGKSFYMREVRYGLADNEYMYEVHIL